MVMQFTIVQDLIRTKNHARTHGREAFQNPSRAKVGGDTRPHSTYGAGSKERD